MAAIATRVTHDHGTERHGFHWSRTVVATNPPRLGDGGQKPAISEERTNLQCVHHDQRVTVNFLTRPRSRSSAQRLRADPADPPSQWLRRHWPWLSLLVVACVGVIDVRRLAGHLRLLRLPQSGRDPRLSPERRRQRLRSERAAHRPPREHSPRQRADRRSFPRTCARPSSPRRTGASTNTTVSTGAACSAPSPGTSAPAAFARASARSRCRWRTTAFSADRYHGRSLRRKLVELRISRLLERELTKDQILEHYLNVIYLGNGVNGIEAASLDLFGKNVNQLSLVRRRGARRRCPRRRRRTRRAAIPIARSQRRNLVLGLMAESGLHHRRRRRSWRSASRCASPRTSGARRSPTSRARSTPCARSSIRCMPDVLKEGDVNVYTTLDFTAQRSADRTMLRHIAQITAETRETMGHVTDEAQGALVALDPATGDIRALVRDDARSAADSIAPSRRDASRAPRSSRSSMRRRSPRATRRRTEVDDEPVDVRDRAHRLAAGELRQRIRRPHHVRARAAALGECRDGARESRGRRDRR